MKKKTGKHRSPKFPFIELKDAVAKLPEIAELKSKNELNRLTLAKLMGHESMSGPAARTIAAFRAYNLIERKDDGPALTAIGERLAKNSDDTEALQIAALSPMAFRRIWRNARNASAEELTELLMSRKFTDKGAARAAEVYRSNAEFAQLDQLEIEPPLPEREEQAGGRARAIEKRLRQKLMAAKAGIPHDALTLPVSSGTVVVPSKLSEAEFDLIVDTLNRWKDQLVK